MSINKHISIIKNKIDLNVSNYYTYVNKKIVKKIRSRNKIDLNVILFDLNVILFDISTKLIYGKIGLQKQN